MRSVWNSGTTAFLQTSQATKHFKTTAPQALAKQCSLIFIALLPSIDFDWQILENMDCYKSWLISALGAKLKALYLKDGSFYCSHQRTFSVEI